MRKQRGASAIDVLLGLAASILFFVILVPPIYTATDRLQKGLRLEQFVAETFIGMEIHYHNTVTTNGGCYNIPPSPLKAVDLAAMDLLDSQLIGDGFYDGGDATLSYQSSTATGRVNRMQIDITFRDVAPGLFSKLPFLVGETPTTLTFRKQMTQSTSGFVMDNITTSFCKDN